MGVAALVPILLPGSNSVGLLTFAASLAGWVVAWFGYMMIFPARVRYEFAPSAICAFRGSKCVGLIPTDQIKTVQADWWTHGQSVVFPWILPALPRFRATLHTGDECQLPRILLDEPISRDISQELLRTAGLRSV